MIRNEFTDSVTGVTTAEVIDLAARTVAIEIDGEQQSTRPFTQHENDLADLDAAFRAAEVNRQTIHTQAAAALTANNTYLAIGSPSAAQNAAQIKALTRQVNKLIRLAVGKLDGTD